MLLRASLHGMTHKALTLKRRVTQERIVYVRCRDEEIVDHLINCLIYLFVYFMNVYMLLVNINLFKLYLIYDFLYYLI